MRIFNRKARYNYEFLDKFEAGVVLLGSEVKSVRQGNITLDDAFVRIDPNLEVWLVNCHIHPYKFADNSSYDPKRSRKLLLHKKEILALLKKMEGRNLTVVPITCYTIGQKIKLELALARGKKFWEKKEKIKQRDLDIDTERAIKGM